MKKNKLKEIALKFLSEKQVKPVYISISGAHLYGFPSANSDFDIRCCHIQPTNDFFHLHKPEQTFEKSFKVDGEEIDIVSHEIEKAIGLAVKNNSNILENLFAENLFPTIEQEEFSRIAKGLISKQVYHPYHGMAEFNYKKFISSKNPHYRNTYIKKYLYILRSYLAGIYALIYGEIEPNIEKLHEILYKNKFENIKTLIKLKVKDEYLSDDTALMEIEKPTEELIAKLKSEMEIAFTESKLQENPDTKEIEEFLYKIRLKNLK